MRYKHLLTLALTLATAAGVNGQPAALPSADPPTSTTLTVIINEDGTEPERVPQDSPWFDPMGIRFFGEAGFNLIRPIQRGPALMGSKPAANAFGGAGVISTQFRYPLQVAPRIMIGGATENGYGVMMSWWGFEDGATTFSATNTAGSGTNFSSVPLPGIPGFTSPSAAGIATGVINDVMSATSRVRIQAWDWDWFFDCNCWGWDVRTTVGARYAYLSQSYTALRVNSGGTLNTDSDYIQSGHNFSGAGPSTAMIVRRPIGRTDAHLFFSSRISVLFGDASQRSTQVSQLAGTIGGVPVNTMTVTNASQTNSICLPCEDTEAGFEWARDLDGGRVFFRTAVVEQTYFDAGSATSLHGNLGVIGMSVVAGILY